MAFDRGWNRDSALLCNATSVVRAPDAPLLAQAMVGESSVDEVMKAGATKWNEYRDKMAKN